VAAPAKAALRGAAAAAARRLRGWPLSRRGAGVAASTAIERASYDGPPRRPRRARARFFFVGGLSALAGRTGCSGRHGPAAVFFAAMQPRRPAGQGGQGECGAGSGFARMHYARLRREDPRARGGRRAELYYGIRRSPAEGGSARDVARVLRGLRPPPIDDHGDPPGARLPRREKTGPWCGRSRRTRSAGAGTGGRRGTGTPPADAEVDAGAATNAAGGHSPRRGKTTVIVGGLGRTAAVRGFPLRSIALGARADDGCPAWMYGGTSYCDVRRRGWSPYCRALSGRPHLGAPLPSALLGLRDPASSERRRRGGRSARRRDSALALQLTNNPARRVLGKGRRGRNAYLPGPRGDTPGPPMG